MTEPATERQTAKLLFNNPASRNLLAVWSRVAGSRYPLEVICDLLGVTDDILDPKLQSMAGLGLVHVIADAQGKQFVEFHTCPSEELETLIYDFLESRAAEFESLEEKVRSLLYITLLTSPY